MKQRGDEADMRTELERNRDSFGFPWYINYLTAALVKSKGDTVSAVLHYFINYRIVRHPVITEITALYEKNFQKQSYSNHRHLQSELRGVHLSSCSTATYNG